VKELADVLKCSTESRRDKVPDVSAETTGTWKTAAHSPDSNKSKKNYSN